MKSFSILLVLLGIAISAYCQTDFAVNALKTKPGDQWFPFEHKIEELQDSKVQFSCMEKQNNLGKWFSFVAKKESITIQVKTGKGMGEILNPILFVGSPKSTGGKREMVELACLKSDNSEAVVSFNNLVPKQEYFVFVSAKTLKKGDRFALEITEKYDEKLDPTKHVVESTRVVMGRIRSADGISKSGVLISLLDESNKPIKSVKSDGNGSFKFEQLPIDQTPIVRIEEDDTELIVDMFLLDDAGEILAQSKRDSTGLYGFDAQKNGFSELRLLSEKDWKINVAKGKTGITGRVVDSETFLYGQSGLEVGLFSEDKSTVSNTKTDKNGNFVFRDLEVGEYLVKIKVGAVKNYSEMVIVDDLNVPIQYSNSNQMGKDGFFKFEKLPSEVVELKRMEEKDSRMKILSDFSKMEEGKPIVLQNILFASGSADLLESSFSELNKLASELTRLPSVNIEISGHTDDVGNKQANLLLSENRAKSVKDYLVTKGVDAKRIGYKGFGDSKPIASNNSEQGKSKNRRVEFIVVN